MEYEIIIVGSGPSGISTALHLAKLSPELAKRTLVLERYSHPRHKLCAGGVLQDGEFILNRLGLDASEVPHVAVNEAKFLYEGRGLCIKRYPESFKVFKREEFDAWLVKKAVDRGITIKEQISVTGIKYTDKGVKVETDKGEYFCKVVVGADGSHSVIQRAIGSNGSSSSAIALEIITQTEDSNNTQPKNCNCAYFDFSMIASGVQGYVWEFPTQDKGKPAHNRGIYNSRICNKKSPLNLKNILHGELSRKNLKLDDYKLEGNLIRWFDANNVFSAPGLFLVGDAAGVDPIYGEGISFALGYGELAAVEIKEAFEMKDFSFSGYKNRITKHSMGRCLKRRLKIARLLYRFQSQSIQKLLWWHLGFMLKWYIEHFLIDWAKSNK